MRPFAFQLSGGNFVVEFGAVGRSESSKHSLRFKFDRTQTVHFGTPECPSLLFCQADKTSAEKCQRGPGTQSFESILEVCHTVLIHLVSLDMAHMRQLAESFAAASRLLHHVFSICSRIEAHLVVGCSCPQT